VRKRNGATWLVEGLMYEDHLDRNVISCIGIGIA